MVKKLLGNKSRVHKKDHFDEKKLNYAWPGYWVHSTTIKVRAPLVTINEYFYEMLFMISMIIMTFIASTVECTTLPEKLKLYLSFRNL